MSSYADTIKALEESCEQANSWSDISPEYAARMRLQNRFKTGLDIARYTAAIMRKDMADYDNDPAHYTQSLGCWHGFIGQQKLISIKKHFGNTDKRYLYLSGWMIAALRSEFGPLPDQSMHEKTSVPALIEELYTFCAKPMPVSWADCSALSMRPERVVTRSKSKALSIRLMSFKRTSCRSLPTLMQASAMRRRPTC